MVPEQPLKQISNPPVHGDAKEVEDGGGGEDHIHGIVHVTHPHREHPVPLQDHLGRVEHHGTH